MLTTQLSRESLRVCGFASAEEAVFAASVAFHALRHFRAQRRGAPVARSSDAAAVTIHEASRATTAAYCFDLRFSENTRGNRS